MTDARLPCPACAHPTLRARAAFETCAVCDWEDDGQDDLNAHLSRGGPNPGSLWDARARTLARGLAAAERWRRVDDVAVDALAGDDASPWESLHDGVVAGLVRRRARVTVMVEIGYLTDLLGARGPALRVELFGCEGAIYTPYEGAPIEDLDTISAAGFDIAEAGIDRGAVALFGSRGQLRLRYEALGLRFGDGHPVSARALEAASNEYWDAFRRQFFDPDDVG